MQDLSDGSMKDLTPFLKDMPDNSPVERLVGLSKLQDKLQAACDAVQPDRSKQGPVFMVGEVLEIKGGRFQVTKIEPGHLRLKSLATHRPA
jgi:hypothetical protein